MANNPSNSQDYTGPLRRLLLVVLSLVLIAIFLVWRIDSPRVERFRAQVTDRIVPNFDWAMAPVTGTINLFRDYQSYQRIAEQNQELRRELRKMQSWKEAALQLEQENARLLDLNKVRLDPRLTFITGVVLADSPDLVRPGDRVVSSGDGGVFPAGLVIGQVAADPGGRLRVRLAADYERLKFLRVLRSYTTEPVTDAAHVLAPDLASNDTGVTTDE